MLPLLPLEPYAGLASVKLLSADPMRGEVNLVLRAPPGVELPRHRTSGPGSLVIEPASACNTPQVLGDGTDDAILLLIVGGDVLLLDEEGQVTSTENWRTAVGRYLDFCREQDIEELDVTLQARGNDGYASQGAA